MATRLTSTTSIRGAFGWCHTQPSKSRTSGQLTRAGTTVPLLELMVRKRVPPTAPPSFWLSTVSSFQSNIPIKPNTLYAELFSIDLKYLHLWHRKLKQLIFLLVGLKENWRRAGTIYIHRNKDRTRAMKAYINSLNLMKHNFGQNESLFDWSTNYQNIKLEAIGALMKRSLTQWARLVDVSINLVGDN